MLVGFASRENFPNVRDTIKSFPSLFIFISYFAVGVLTSFLRNVGKRRTL